MTAEIEKTMKGLLRESLTHSEQRYKLLDSDPVESKKEHWKAYNKQKTFFSIAKRQFSTQEWEADLPNKEKKYLMAFYWSNYRRHICNLETKYENHTGCGWESMEPRNIKVLKEYENTA